MPIAGFFNYPLDRTCFEHVQRPRVQASRFALSQISVRARQRQALRLQ